MQDHRGLTVEQMRDMLAQKIAECEDRGLLERMCSLFAGSGEGTVAASQASEVEGTQAEGTADPKPPAPSKTGMCSNPDGCEHCLTAPKTARRGKWKEMYWWRELLMKTTGPINEYLQPLGSNRSKEQTYIESVVPSGVGQHKDKLLVATFGDKADEEHERFKAQRAEETCPMLCSNCFHNYIVERQKKDPAPKSTGIKRKLAAAKRQAQDDTPVAKQAKVAASAVAASEVPKADPKKPQKQVQLETTLLLTASKNLSRRKKEYELRSGDTLLKQATAVKNFGQDPLGAEPWVHLLRSYINTSSVVAEVYATLPKNKADILIHDADMANQMLWVVLSVAMADEPLSQEEDRMSLQLYNKHSQNCFSGSKFNPFQDGLSNAIDSFGLSEVDIANGDFLNFSDPMEAIGLQMDIHSSWSSNRDAWAMICIMYRILLMRQERARDQRSLPWNLSLTRDPKRRQQLTKDMHAMFESLDPSVLFQMSGEYSLSHESVARCMADHPEHTDQIVSMVVGEFLRDSWVWAHIRAVSLTRDAIQVLYDDEGYQCLQSSQNQVHLLEKGDVELYPQCDVLPFGRKTWHASVIDCTGVAPADAVRRAQEDAGAYKFFYLYASAVTEHTGILCTTADAARSTNKPSLMQREFSIFDHLLLASSRDDPNTLHWIQTVDMGQNDPVSRCAMKSGRCVYDPGKPLFHEISGTAPLWDGERSSNASEGIIVAVPESVSIVDTDLPTLSGPGGGWRSPLFVTEDKGTVSVYAVFNQYDYLRDVQDKVPIESRAPADLDIRLFGAHACNFCDAATDQAFVQLIETVGAEIVRSKVLEGIRDRGHGTTSTKRKLHPHLLPKFQPFHGFLIAISRDILPACIETQCESISDLKKQGLYVPMRSHLEIPWRKISFKGKSVWWPRTG